MSVDSSSQPERPYFFSVSGGDIATNYSYGGGSSADPTA
jgi:hypothetical protein